ncbi:hypothetical protein CEXT_799541, partial [Caerostris extrusa]
DKKKNTETTFWSDIAVGSDWTRGISARLLTQKPCKSSKKNRPFFSTTLYRRRRGWPRTMGGRKEIYFRWTNREF